MSYIVPTGFRFEPTDEELILNFLLPKAMGYPVPWNGFPEKEVYGDHATPWNVFSNIDGDESWYCNTKKDGGGTKKIIYVFTKLTKSALKLNAKRIARRAGCGVWNGQTSAKYINNSSSGEIIGCVKLFSFRRRHQESTSEYDDGRHWIMHEYSLTGSSLMVIGERNSDIVVCKITKCVKVESSNQPPHFSFPVAGETGNKRPAPEELPQEERACSFHGVFLGLEGCAMPAFGSYFQIPTTAGDSLGFPHK